MKLLLVVLALVFLPFDVFADDGKNCSINLGAGQISIDANRFTMSAAEQRLMQDPHIVASRTVHNKTDVQQISLGCMVTEHWGVDVVATRGIEFAIENTIDLPDLAAFEETNNLPVTPTSATVTRSVKANTTLGAVVNYVLPINDSFSLRFGVGIHRITLNETSQIEVSDVTGRHLIIPGPSEKKSGNIPTITIGAGMKVARDFSLAGQFYVPAKGVRAVFVTLKYDF
ncbi:MAG: hypothetical protein A2937_02610 [Candidatus Yonathbacteria bacterium RIFCSPLOWO2_01_FULL_47_33b]|uniref:Outer membrane protein beta-barrel domain-containing protein n=1 Tax=Candidatus Yonathbacteria bacterium RIFCSPLOWO2_01_FULL_47_33b TaxID=1802727 RepID=A0A1G2SH73_9BACT|nr:MAG: hypothetical protein A2937_02610 [Candidatus Yonathbacteria bacterium RIFCSPLOWO2_01_FULL_47_33b]